jgi:hypothetical protein
VVAVLFYTLHNIKFKFLLQYLNLTPFKRHIILFFLLIITMVTYAQDYDWVKFYQGTGSQFPVSMEVDEYGNQYAAFNNSLKTITVDSQQIRGRNLLLKQDSSGAVKWYSPITAIDTTQLSSILGISFTNTGSLLCLVASRDSAILIGKDTVIGREGSYSNNNVYLLELDTSGNLLYGALLLYGRLIDFTGNYTANKLAVDEYNNLFLSLQFSDSLYIYDTSGQHLYIHSVSNLNRLMKFSSAGKKLQWITYLPAASSSRSTFSITDLDVDIRGNTYLSVYFSYSQSDSAIFSTAGFSPPKTSLAKVGAVFVVGPSGKGKNWYYLRSTVTLSISNITVHDTNSVFIYGTIYGDSIVSGSYKLKMPNKGFYHFYARLDINGNVDWLRHEDTSYSYSSSQYSSNGTMTNYADEFVYLSYRGSYNSGRDPIYGGQTFPAPAGMRRAYGMNMKIDHRGNVLWGIRSSFAPFKAIGTDALSNFYFQGSWWDWSGSGDTVVFGNYQAINNTKWDAFIGKTADYSIFRGDVSPGPYCAGDTFYIPYTKHGTYSDSNQFIAELSDEFGNFNGTERELGRIKSAINDTITGFLPLFQVVSSAQYRIRIVSTHPQVQSFYRLDTLNLLIYSRDTANPGGTDTLCYGDTLMLSTTGGTQWSWSPAYNIDDSSARQPQVWPDTSLVYQITISDSSGCGEADTAFKSVFVRDKPTLQSVFTDSTVCPIDSIELKVTAGGGDSASYTVSWYRNALLSSNLIKSERLSGSTDSIWVSGIEGDTSGTEYFALLNDSCGSYTDTLRFTIRSYLPLKVNFTVNDATLCRADTFRTSPVVTGGRTGTYAYIWSDISGVLSNTSSEITVNTSFGDTGTLQVVVNDGCMFIGDSSNFTFQFYSPLNPDIYHQNKALKDTVLCPGETIRLKSGKEPYRVDSLQYDWKISGNSFSSADLFALNADSVRKATGVHMDSVLNAYLIFKMTSGCESQVDSILIRFLPQSTNAIEFPVASVIDDSNMEIHYQQLPVPNVYGYKLFAMRATGRVLIDSVSSADANNVFFIEDSITSSSRNCYQIETLDSCGNISKSEIFCTQRLNGDPGQLMNEISWKLDSGLNPEALWLWNGSAWDSIGRFTSSDSFFVHNDLSCDKAYSYRLSFTGKIGGEYYSAPITLTSFDTISPAPPERLDVSVNINGKVALRWLSSVDANVESYTIWRDTGNGFKKITSTSDTTYNDILINPKNAPPSYYIVAVDSCGNGNISLPSDTIRHIRSFSSTAGCSAFIKLRWEEYSGGSVIHRILRSTNGINYSLIDSVDSDVFEYTDSSVAQTTKYHYRIEVYSPEEGISIYSDTTTLTPFVYPVPIETDLTYVSVLNSGTTGQTEINWKSTDLTDTLLRGYYIWEFINSDRNLIHNETDLNTTKFSHSPVNTIDLTHTYGIGVYNLCKADTGSLNWQSTISKQHRTIQLGVTNRNLEMELGWSQYVGFPVSNYEIFRSKEGGMAQLIATVNGSDSIWLDTLVYCKQRYRYHVVAHESGGLRTSYSNSIEAIAYDTISPSKIKIINASVLVSDNLAGKIDLEIEGSGDRNAHQIFLYRIEDNSAPVLIDSIPDPVNGTFNYTDIGLNTMKTSYGYVFVARDSCGNLSTPSDTFNLILLKTVAMNNAVQLNWTTHRGYDQWTYEIQRLSPANNWRTIAEHDSKTHSYIDTQVICIYTYTYRILCKDVSRSIYSLSNEASETPIDTIAPLEPILLNASMITPNEQILLEWNTAKERDVAGYTISSAEESEISIIRNPSTDQLTIQWKNLEDLCFYIRTYDSCGNISSSSKSICQIVPHITTLKSSNSIEWNAYQFGGAQDISHYDIFVSTDTINWMWVTQVPADQTSFIHEDLDLSQNTFTYQIRAYSDKSPVLTSNSAVVTVTRPAVVWIPTAFSPYSSPDLNDSFGPIGTWVTSFTLEIWNLWGQKVYQSQNSEKWDGLVNGDRTVGSSVYIYQISVTGANGERKHFKGTVTLVD